MRRRDLARDPEDSESRPDRTATSARQVRRGARCCSRPGGGATRRSAISSRVCPGTATVPGAVARSSKAAGAGPRQESDAAGRGPAGSGSSPRLPRRGAGSGGAPAARAGACAAVPCPSAHRAAHPVVHWFGTDPHFGPQWAFSIPGAGSY